MGNLADKTVLITGAIGGIGRATATHFLDQGARVFLIDLDADTLSNFCQKLGDRAAYCVCDVTSEAEMEVAFNAAEQKFGGVDVAILNAGIVGKIAPLGQISAEEFDRVIAVNLRGVFLGLSQALPRMKKRGGGSVIVVSSTGGLRGTANFAPYVASKHGAVGLMRSAALEGAASNVRVNSVNPGPTDTDMMGLIDQARSPGTAEQARVQTAQAIPMQRYGTPNEIAKLIGFLASDEASFCTGNTYVADGGIMAGQ